MQDLLTAIKGSYGTTPDFAINMSNGQINFSTATGAMNGINIQLTSLDASNNATAGLSSNAGITYDNAAFTQSGNTLLSNVPQIVKSDNSYATNSTKLSDVAGTSPFVSTGAPQQLKLSGTNINGTPFNAQIDIKNTADGGSTFSLDGGTTNYAIYNMASPRTAVDGNDMTYKQLTDVVNMVVSNTLPASNTSTNYDNAVTSADSKSTVSLDVKGQIQFEDKNASTTKANISFSDANSTSTTLIGSGLEFNANSALTISDPKTDFFASIDAIISSVEQGKYRADASSGDLRNAGIQKGIQMIDNLDRHISKEQSKSGVQSQSLQAASDRAQTLTLNAQSLRSNVTDTDIAQATLQLSQLQLNYQAIYSTISKVSQLSLVNYIK